MLDRVGELVTKPVDGHGGHRGADRAGRVRGRGGRAPAGHRRRPGRLGRPGGGRAVLPPDAVRRPGCSPGTSTCGRSSTSGAPGRGLHPGRPGADPGRPGRQPGRQLLARRRGQGHLDLRTERDDDCHASPSAGAAELGRSRWRGDDHVRIGGEFGSTGDAPTSAAVRADHAPGCARAVRTAAGCGRGARSPSAIGGCRSST